MLDLLRPSLSRIRSVPADALGQSEEAAGHSVRGFLVRQDCIALLNQHRLTKAVAVTPLDSVAGRLVPVAQV